MESDDSFDDHLAYTSLVLENKTLDELLASLNFTSLGEFIDFYGVELEPIAYDLSAEADAGLITSYTVIFLLALVGNILVVFAVVHKRSMRTVINAFIVSLATSDLLITLFCIPFTLLEIITVDWVLGTYMCKLLNYITMVAVVSSVLTLTTIAVERHHAICYPLRARIIQTPRRAAILIAGLWVSSMLLVSPLLFVHKVILKEDPLIATTYKFCREAWPHPEQKKAFTLLLVLFVYVIPVLTMTVLYLRVVHRLWIRKAISPLEAQGSQANASSLRNKRRATKMLIVVVILFAVCWLPFHVVSIIRDFSHMRDSERNRLMLAIVQLIGFSNSFNNPIVYAFLNENFKRTFRKTLCVRPQTNTAKKKAKKSTTHLVSPYAVQTTL
ncbi:pyroglutamylated RFamide peptide receptor-like [Acanthaster planci]|uniref:Pyroglutamylated RFamide peptide receptor-like n=1 Tax=Acanthaster planci TaxID=133434 RepID=A0A8B7Y2N4_ACAPL|nr:pyroglutamylated RFamide peptide receptor-like [Acanthaster planci]XP_022087437.1 pyroglutamylated RFamide peptide receptor-like [Acanthaster planci]XP_022087438.1 pyroglutamylated RFamide peptide receptor-like [Acanthaster planci]XP_022087439.1 pyroglutamylated RFamide peptide receptor-like [Acanthaster planci]XP_022087440.1 pyroglutamylated RFamide peptide receptor-like [Acanthaster planci]